MTHKSARREYLDAVAEFQRACRDFAEGMRRVTDPPPPPIESLSLLAPLRAGPRKPAKRAPRRVQNASVTER